MYASIDLVFDKIDRQLRDAKDSAATDRRKGTGGVTQLSGKARRRKRVLRERETLVSSSRTVVRGLGAGPPSRGACAADTERARNTRFEFSNGPGAGPPSRGACAAGKPTTLGRALSVSAVFVSIGRFTHKLSRCAFRHPRRRSDRRRLHRHEQARCLAALAELLCEGAAAAGVRRVRRGRAARARGARGAAEHRRGQRRGDPHGRVGGLDRFVGALAIHRAGVDFEAIDGRPVSILFAVIGPERAAGEHLQVSGTHRPPPARRRRARAPAAPRRAPRTRSRSCARSTVSQRAPRSRPIVGAEVATRDRPVTPCGRAAGPRDRATSFSVLRSVASRRTITQRATEALRELERASRGACPRLCGTRRVSAADRRRPSHRRHRRRSTSRRRGRRDGARRRGHRVEGRRCSPRSQPSVR